MARQNNLYDKIMKANGMSDLRQSDSDAEYASDNNAEVYVKYEEYKKDSTNLSPTSRDKLQ